SSSAAGGSNAAAGPIGAAGAQTGAAAGPSGAAGEQIGALAGPSGAPGQEEAGAAGQRTSSASEQEPDGARAGAVRPARIVIAYDTRRNSRAFAEVAASVVAANGMEALLFDGPRATPELSFAVPPLRA